ncbi:MAG: 3-isopropylmalate dehydratase large subunit [Eubacteriales bacterium]|nr:3-isopropylmalate dehydratase large subunit [Eubacteriales bacterium]
MGMTLIEKIIARNIGAEKVSPGEIVTVNVDRVMVHDIFIPFVADKFEEMGFQKIWDPDKMVLIYDHLVPASQLDDARHFARGDAFAAKYGVKNVHRSDGICHQLMTEAGYVKPGDIAFGTDSHTVTYGCVGAFSTGIGYTEMAGILGTGKLWIRVPGTIRVEVNGTLPDNVTSKDVILQILGDLRADGATYKSLEFSGSTFDSMSVASRMTMANMTVECGAKCGLFAPDEKTAEYCGIPLEDFRKDTFLQNLHGDPDAACDRILTYRAEDFVPVAACPSQVDNIRPVREIAGLPVDQVFLGSCTNGRLEDLAAAAEIMKGKKVAPFVKFIVTPASRKIYREALEAGILDILMEAGAILTHPGCGLCCGRAGGILTDNEVVVATNNRNFLGRMGTSKVQIYLASPRTAAASAIAGKITVPE